MIDQLEAIEVNGTTQWLLHRGNDVLKPIVLFVHGGPGYPLMWFSRAFDEVFLDDFVVVHWDQRSAGKSYSPDTPVETFALSQIVKDGITVTEHLKAKFQQNNIMLVGHSWGTMVGSHMAANRPDLFSAYVTVGTVSDTHKTDELKFDLLTKIAEQKSDKEAASKLQALGPPPYRSFDEHQQLGNLIVLLIGFKSTSRKFTEEDFATAILRSKEYSEPEIEKAFAGLQVAMNALGEFMSTYRSISAVPRIEIPVYFAQGKHDLNTPTTLARDYFNQLDAPSGKHWIEFENSAHFPMYEESTKFLDVLKKALQTKAKVEDHNRNI